jgi:hypothetical protein
VQTAMLAELPYTELRDAILTHPTMAEGSPSCSATSRPFRNKSGRHDISMLIDPTVDNTKGVDGDRRFWPPVAVATVGHDKIAVSANHFWIKLESGPSGAATPGLAPSAVRDHGVGLDSHR